MFPSAHLIILGPKVIQLPLGLVSGWWGLMNIEYDNPTCHSGRNPSDLMVCCSWMAQEIICGKQSHNNPWQRTIMLWRPESPMPISSLLFIRTARPPSPGQPAYYYSLKQQEVAIVYLELVFFRLVLSVATLQKAERKKHLCLSKCQLPLDPGCSGKWNFPVRRSLGLLILDWAANWPAILHSAEGICSV